MNENIKEYVSKLQGINYPEWIKLRTAIDRAFSQKRSEFEKELKLTDSELILNLIQSQFG